MYCACGNFSAVAGFELLRRLAVDQHRVLAVEHVAHDSPWMRVASAARVGRRFDEHDHDFVIRVRDLDRAQDSAFDGGRGRRICGVHRESDGERRANRDHGAPKLHVHCFSERLRSSE